jgi:adenylosuccinate synthase
VLTKIYNRRAISVQVVMDELLPYAARLAPMVADTSLLLEQALDDGKNVLLEAGQATLLDVDHGTYPYVTSSQRDRRWRVHRAPASPRPGSRASSRSSRRTRPASARPFPTELFDDNGEFLRKTGAEYGTTTGRPRRCGWLDTVIGRYATRINGVTDFVVTKLDVLTGLDKVPICVAYDVDGVRHDEMPVNQSDFHHAKPIYEEHGRLVGGHQRLPQLRGASRERAGLRPARRGAHRRPRLGHRRRPGRDATRSSRASASCAPPGLAAEG